MAVSQHSKLEIVQHLLATKQKGHNLEIILRFKGKHDEADQVATKTAELTDLIDTLLGQIIDEWLSNSRGIVNKIKKANAQLQRSIREITKGVKTAQNIVKAIGFIDDAVVIASKFAAAV